MPAPHEAAFLTAVPALRPRLHRYLARMLGSVVDAEDLTQESLAQAHRKLDDLRDPAALEGWVFRIAHHKALDWLRTRKPETELADELVAPPASLAAADLTPALGALLLGLPPRERSAVLLKDVLDMSLAEVAETSEVSVGAVKAALHRARGKLAAGVPVPPPRELTGAQRAWVDRYLACFNRRDWDGVCALTRQDVHIEVVDAGGGTGHEFMREGYFRNYTRLWPWRFSRARVGGEELVVQWRPSGDGGWTPLSVMDLHMEAGKLAAARDFVHVEYLLVGLPVAELSSDQGGGDQVA